MLGDQAPSPGGRTLKLPFLQRALRVQHYEAGGLAHGVSASPGEAEQLLTDREQAVLALLAGELTYGQIAEALVISINTVRTHVRRIYKELGVHRRDQAVQRAQELGLLPRPPD